MAPESLTIPRPPMVRLPGWRYAAIVDYDEPVHRFASSDGRTGEVPERLRGCRDDEELARFVSHLATTSIVPTLPIGMFEVVVNRLPGNGFRFHVVIRNGC